MTAAVSGCGKSEPPGDPLETEAYRQWKGSQYMRRLPAANSPPPRPAARDRPSPGALEESGDFCEVYVNGEKSPLQHRPPSRRELPVNFFEFTFSDRPNTSTCGTRHQPLLRSRGHPPVRHFQCVRRRKATSSMGQPEVPDLDK